MTASEIAKKLTEGGIDPDTARFEARLLIEHIMKITPAQILADPGRDYDCKELCEAAEKRASRYPLQYIIGQWEFCGLPITVDENCLIPRPDTEITAERAIELMPDGGRYLDLCTGSGCIAAAVLTYTKAKRSSGYAVEICPAAAELAKRNIASLGLSDRCDVIIGDASADLFADMQPDEYFDIITANPPYIAEDEMPSLEAELAHEPKIALTDGGDGLSLIRAIIEVYGKRLSADGVMIVEHGWKQHEAVAEIAESCGMSCTGLKDFGGNIRAAEIRRKTERCYIK